MESPLLHNALGSATAGIISRVFTHPLDTAKAQMQAGGLQAASMKNPIDAIIKTYSREGVKGVYRGFGAVIVGGTPGTMIYLCGYEWCKVSISSSLNGNDLTTNNGPEKSSAKGDFVIHFLSGMFAETVACLIYVPVDVVKERLQVQSLSVSSLDRGVSGMHQYDHLYRGSWDALNKIMSTEGLSGIYRGYLATLASFGPFSALYFMFYEQFKKLARRSEVDFNKKEVKDLRENFHDGDMSFPLLLTCSCSAGALASFLTSPLDMAKLRLQIQRGKASTLRKSAPSQYNNMFDCLKKIYLDSGIKGLFRGAGARVLHFAPATTITMTLYEKCRSFYCHALGSKGNLG